MSDLVERLRARANWYPKSAGSYSPDPVNKALFNEAADALERAERERDEALALRLPGPTPPAEYADFGEDSLRALVKMRDRQIGYFRTFWVRDAKQALAGDPRALRLRVEMAEAPPMKIVQSHLLSPQGQEEAQDKG